MRRNCIVVQKYSHTIPSHSNPNIVVFIRITAIQQQDLYDLMVTDREIAKRQDYGDALYSIPGSINLCKRVYGIGTITTAAVFCTVVFMHILRSEQHVTVYAVLPFRLVSSALVIFKQ